jgi:hypothetical protein
MFPPFDICLPILRILARRFYMNPDQEIELVLDNPRSAHILGMPGISKASAVVVHQIFHTHPKG